MTTVLKSYSVSFCSNTAVYLWQLLELNMKYLYYICWSIIRTCYTRKCTQWPLHCKHCVPCIAAQQLCPSAFMKLMFTFCCYYQKCHWTSNWNETPVWQCQQTPTLFCDKSRLMAEQLYWILQLHCAVGPKRVDMVV